MSESLQHKLDRVRPPRVQITYDVEIGGAIQKKELPFVVGVLADLSGKPAQPLPLLKARKFVEIDRDNFNEILKNLAPRVAFAVENTLAPAAGATIGVDITFENMDSFGPLAVIDKVDPLKKLFAARQRLSDLLAKLDGNPILDGALNDVSKDQASLTQIKGALTEGSAK